jgi:hypothetical protein
MKPYKLQAPGSVRYEFCCDILARIENDNDLTARFIFSDEATFHINGKVNRHNVRVWRTENRHVTLQHERDSLKVNVFYAISKEKVYGPFFFVENTVTGNSYLDMLTLWLLPQMEEDSDDFIFQQDGALPHFHVAFRNHLNVLQRWIGRAGANDATWYV